MPYKYLVRAWIPDDSAADAAHDAKIQDAVGENHRDPTERWTNDLPEYGKVAGAPLSCLS